MQVRLSQSEEGVRQEQNENYFHQFFLTADLDSPLILLIFQSQRASVFPEYSLDFWWISSAHIYLLPHQVPLMKEPGDAT